MACKGVVADAAGVAAAVAIAGLVVLLCSCRRRLKRWMVVPVVSRGNKIVAGETGTADEFVVAAAAAGLELRSSAVFAAATIVSFVAELSAE